MIDRFGRKRHQKKRKDVEFFQKYFVVQMSKWRLAVKKSLSMLYPGRFILIESVTPLGNFKDINYDVMDIWLPLIVTRTIFVFLDLGFRIIEIDVH